MGQSTTKIVPNDPAPLHDISKRQQINQLNPWSVSLITVGYLRDIFNELQQDKSYESVIKLSIPINIYELCYQYGLLYNRFIFQITNEFHHSVIKYKYNILNESIKCDIKNAKRICNVSYHRCKSLYVNNIKIAKSIITDNDETNEKSDICDVIFLCAAGTYLDSHASMIIITNCCGYCHQLPWKNDWRSTICSNLTYHKSYGLLVGIKCDEENIHRIYSLRLSNKELKWKELIVCNLVGRYIFIQIIYKDEKTYLFATDGEWKVKLYDFSDKKWIIVNIMKEISINKGAKIFYDEFNNRIYFIDRYNFRYFDVFTFKWMLLEKPSLFNPLIDIICVKHADNVHHLMIIGRNYELRYKKESNKWIHQHLQSLPNQHHTYHQTPESYVLI